ncbi:hypothetical protein [Streptomyces sp. AM 2-1-1]|uniref:hypothetical protein n=1 Tax=Streptomyces sp. AM 2-1-1 TaxID=3028709 RepID=UPI0023B95985|nr:hypothetical protein [Streptomyces sp. AM 2-1-1]WEH39931.1 hypothetical protein PZB77_10605 [Streptomyces sp. AM 2-1-1]
MRSRTAGALVHLARDLMVHRARDGTLGTAELRERFGGRLGLLRLPGLAVTALAVLVAARLLSDDHRAFRVLYPLTPAWPAPLVGVGYGYAVSGELMAVEGMRPDAGRLVRRWCGRGRRGGPAAGGPRRHSAAAALAPVRPARQRRTDGRPRLAGAGPPVGAMG